MGLYRRPSYRAHSWGDAGDLDYISCRMASVAFELGMGGMDSYINPHASRGLPQWCRYSLSRIPQEPVFGRKVNN